jgi:hypothetical protein
MFSSVMDRGNHTFTLTEWPAIVRKGPIETNAL